MTTSASMTATSTSCWKRDRGMNHGDTEARRRTEREVRSNMRVAISVPCASLRFQGSATRTFERTACTGEEEELARDSGSPPTGRTLPEFATVWPLCAKAGSDERTQTVTNSGSLLLVLSSPCSRALHRGSAGGSSHLTERSSPNSNDYRSPITSVASEGRIAK